MSYFIIIIKVNNFYGDLKNTVGRFIEMKNNFKRIFDSNYGPLVHKYQRF